MWRVGNPLRVASSNIAGGIPPPTPITEVAIAASPLQIFHPLPSYTPNRLKGLLALVAADIHVPV